MSGTLIFIENSNEINLLVDYIKEDTIVVSMQPSVGVELEKRGIKYQNTIKFFGINGHKNVIERSTQIVEELRPFIKVLSSKEIKHAFEKTWIFYLRFFLHYWLATIFVIHKAVECYKPDKFIALKLNQVSKLNMNVTGNNQILGLVIEEYGKAHGIKVHCINNFIKTSNVKLFSNLIKQKLSVIVFEFLLRIYPFISHNKVPLLVPDDSYNMSRFLDEVGHNIKESLPIYLGKRRSKIGDLIRNIIKGNSFTFYSVPIDKSFSTEREFRSKLDICVSKIQAWLISSPIISNYYDVGLNDPLLEFIKNGLKKGMLDLHGQTKSLQRIVETVKPKYVFSQHSLGISYVLGEYCVYKSIPALLISHASHVPHLGTLPHLEWSVHAHTLINTKYPFVAVQSPWALKFIKEQQNFVSKVIETGPLLFSKKNKLDLDYKKSRKVFKKFSHKKIFLHASSPRGWSVLRPFIYETFDEYIRNLTDIIEAIESNPDSYLAIRFRPTYGLSLSDLEASLPRSSSYDIYIDGSFEQYLLESDILISYSSTTIEEALQNHVPVLQYDPDGKYMHIPGQRLSQSNKKSVSSVYSVYDKTDLFDAIGWLGSVDIHNSGIEWSKHITSSDDDMNWLYQLI